MCTTDYGRFVPGFDVPPTLRHHEMLPFVQRDGEGRYALRYTRRYMAPIARLWAALSEPSRLADCIARDAPDAT